MCKDGGNGFYKGGGHDCVSGGYEFKVSSTVHWEGNRGFGFTEEGGTLRGLMVKHRE